MNKTHRILIPLTLLALAAVLLFSSFLPIFVVKRENLPKDEHLSTYSSLYTSFPDIKEFSVSIPALMPVIQNMDYALLLFELETHNMSIGDIQISIKLKQVALQNLYTDYAEQMDAGELSEADISNFQSKHDSIQKDIENYNKDIQKHQLETLKLWASLSEKESKELDTLMEDPEFQKGMLILFAYTYFTNFYSSFGSSYTLAVLDGSAMPEPNFDKLLIGLIVFFGPFIGIISLVGLCVLVIWRILLSVFMLFSSTWNLLSATSHSDNNPFGKLLSKDRLYFFMFLLFSLWMGLIYGGIIQLGAGTIVFSAVYLLLFAVRGISRILRAEKISRNRLYRWGISLLATAFSLVLIFAYCGSSILRFDSFQETFVFSEGNSLATVEGTAEAFSNYAVLLVRDIFGKLAVFFVAIAVCQCFAGFLGGQEEKNKQGETKYFYNCFAGVFLTGIFLVLYLLIFFFTSNPVSLPIWMSVLCMLLGIASHYVPQLTKEEDDEQESEESTAPASTTDTSL